MSTVASGLRHRRERLHRRAQPDRLARAHPALDAAGARGLARRCVPPREHDLVVRPRARPGGRGEPVPDLDALHRLDAHERERQPRVELAVVVHVGAEPRRRAVRHAPRTPRRACRASVGAGRSRPPSARRGRVEAPDRASASIASRSPGAGTADRAGDLHRADPHHVRKRPRCRAPRGTPCSRYRRPRARRSPARWPARGRCARRRTRTSALPARSACPGRGRVRRASGPCAPSTPIRSRYFDSNSAFGIVIATGEPSVRPCRTPAEDLEPVGLEALPAAPPVALPAPRELGGELLRHDRGRRRGGPRGRPPAPSRAIRRR